MKLASAFSIVILSACSARGANVSLCSHPGTTYAPPTLGSPADARTYVGVLHAGGRVAILKAGAKPVLVVYVYGYAVPDVAIAAYRPAAGRWVRAREWGGGAEEEYRAVIENDAVMVVGAKTGRRCVLVERGAPAG